MSRVEVPGCCRGGANWLGGPVPYGDAAPECGGTAPAPAECGGYARGCELKKGDDVIKVI